MSFPREWFEFSLRPEYVYTWVWSIHALSTNDTLVVKLNPFSMSWFWWMESIWYKDSTFLLKKDKNKVLLFLYSLYFRLLVEIKCCIIFFCVARRQPSVRRYHYPSDSSRLLPMYASKVRMPGSNPGIVVAAEFPLQVLLTSKRSHWFDLWMALTFSCMYIFHSRSVFVCTLYGIRNA